MRRAAGMAAVALMLSPVLAVAGGSLRDGASVPAPASMEPGWTYDAGNAGDFEPVSPGKAVLYSLLLPGLGDYKLGNRGRATVFFSVEAGIWVSYAVFHQQGSSREDEYQNLAVQFAGVSRTGHSDEFYATVREYNSSLEYEADVKNDGRYALGEVLNSQQLEQYFLENRVADYETWQWVSNDRRLQYSEVRSSSKTSYRRADYMLAAAVANRVVSSIFAYASARGMEKNRDVGFDLRVSPAPGGVDVAFSVTKPF